MSKTTRLNLNPQELEYLSDLLLQDSKTLLSASIRLKLAKQSLGKQITKQGAIDDIMSIDTSGFNVPSLSSEQDAILQASLDGSITPEQEERYFVLTGFKL